MKPSRDSLSGGLEMEWLTFHRVRLQSHTRGPRRGPEGRRRRAGSRTRPGAAPPARGHFFLNEVFGK